MPKEPRVSYLPTSGREPKYTLTYEALKGTSRVGLWYQVTVFKQSSVSDSKNVCFTHKIRDKTPTDLGLIFANIETKNKSPMEIKKAFLQACGQLVRGEVLENKDGQSARLRYPNKHKKPGPEVFEISFDSPEKRKAFSEYVGSLEEDAAHQMVYRAYLRHKYQKSDVGYRHKSCGEVTFLFSEQVKDKILPDKLSPCLSCSVQDKSAGIDERLKMLYIYINLFSLHSVTSFEIAKTMFTHSRQLRQIFAYDDSRYAVLRAKFIRLAIGWGEQYYAYYPENDTTASQWFDFCQKGLDYLAKHVGQVQQFVEKKEGRGLSDDQHTFLTEFSACCDALSSIVLPKTNKPEEVYPLYVKDAEYQSAQDEIGQQARKLKSRYSRFISGHVSKKPVLSDLIVEINRLFEKRPSTDSALTSTRKVKRARSAVLFNENHFGFTFKFYDTRQKFLIYKGGMKEAYCTRFQEKKIAQVVEYAKTYISTLKNPDQLKPAALIAELKKQFLEKKERHLFSGKRQGDKWVLKLFDGSGPRRLAFDTEAVARNFYFSVCDKELDLKHRLIQTEYNRQQSGNFNFNFYVCINTCSKSICFEVNSVPKAYSKRVETKRHSLIPVGEYLTKSVIKLIGAVIPFYYALSLKDETSERLESVIEFVNNIGVISIWLSGLFKSGSKEKIDKAQCVILMCIQLAMAGAENFYHTHHAGDKAVDVFLTFINDVIAWCNQQVDQIKAIRGERGLSRFERECIRVIPFLYQEIMAIKHAKTHPDFIVKGQTLKDADRKESFNLARCFVPKHQQKMMPLFKKRVMIAANYPEAVMTGDLTEKVLRKSVKDHLETLLKSLVKQHPVAEILISFPEHVLRQGIVDLEKFKAMLRHVVAPYAKVLIALPINGIREVAKEGFNIEKTGLLKQYADVKGENSKNDAALAHYRNQVEEALSSENDSTVFAVQNVVLCVGKDKGKPIDWIWSKTTPYSSAEGMSEEFDYLGDHFKDKTMIYEPLPGQSVRGGAYQSIWGKYITGEICLQSLLAPAASSVPGALTEEDSRLTTHLVFSNGLNPDRAKEPGVALGYYCSQTNDLKAEAVTFGGTSEARGDSVAYHLSFTEGWQLPKYKNRNDLRKGGDLRAQEKTLAPIKIVDILRQCQLVDPAPTASAFFTSSSGGSAGRGNMEGKECHLGAHK